MTIVICSFVKSQDVLILKNGDELQTKITEVGISEVKYKMYDNQTGPIHVILKSEIFMIKYENGTKELIKSNVSIINVGGYNNADVCKKGQKDAELYHGKTGKHMLGGFLLGPFAVIGSALANPTPEKGDKTLEMSKNRDEINNDFYYRDCYIKKARTKNIVNTFAGWAGWLLLYYFFR